MSKKTSAFLSAVLFLATTINLSGCHKTDRQISYDSGAYSSHSFSIPQKDGYESILDRVLSDSENTVCIPVVYVKYDENKENVIDVVTDIYTVNDEGDLVYTLEVMGSQPPDAIIDDEYVYLGYSISDPQESNSSQNETQKKVAVFLNKKTGDLTRTIESDFDPRNIVNVSGGFVLVGDSTICMYSREGKEKGRVETGFVCYNDSIGFFEDMGRFFVVEERDLFSYVYHEVDFNNSVCIQKCSATEIGITTGDIDGQYFFNPDGEYKVDLINMKVGCIADWNSIDIRPPQNKLYTPSRRYHLDDNRFAISYEYYDESRSKEILILRYDKTIDRSGIVTIKIGGFGVYDDLMLQWAVYKFNTSNTDFRVILEDYSSKFGGNLEESVLGKLNLMKYFNEGNSPDIFYGTQFDYEYMGRNNMVFDLSGYFDSETELTETAKRLLFDENGACFQVFASYSLNGYYMRKEVIDAVDNLSLSSIYKYAKEQDITFSIIPAANIIDEAIRYSFADLWGAYDGNKKISQEELENMISDVVSIPRSDRSLASEDDVVNGRVLMFPRFCSSYYDEEDRANSYKEDFVFIGYPSVHGAIHLAEPQCLMAISTTTSNKEKCWEILSLLFSEDIQKQAIVSQRIPVTNKAMNILCESIMNPGSSTIEAWREMFGKRKEGNREVLDKFLTEIASADTLATYDWGLFNIIVDEIDSYYSQTRSPSQIAESLDKRLTIYMQENYT